MLSHPLQQSDDVWKPNFLGLRVTPSPLRPSLVLNSGLQEQLGCGAGTEGVPSPDLRHLLWIRVQVSNLSIFLVLLSVACENKNNENH